MNRGDPCTVDACERPITRPKLGLCEAHYYRRRRTGSLGKEPIREYDSSRICSIEGCGESAVTRGWCSMHYTRWVRHGDPAAMPMPQAERAIPAGEDHYNWSGDTASYAAAHQRVAKARGPASSHVCAECGSPARQWSVIRVDGSSMPHSPDPQDYRPLCVPCHKTYDLAALRA